MPTNESCRVCKHCVLGKSTSYGWCRLRKIKVHPEIAPFVLCHHWTKKEPSLPRLEDQERNIYMEKQLDFGRDLAEIEG